MKGNHRCIRAVQRLTGSLELIHPFSTPAWAVSAKRV